MVLAWLDALRLVALPVFLWASYHDLRTRHVPNTPWVALGALGLVCLCLEALIRSAAGLDFQWFLLGAALNIGILFPLAYGFFVFRLMGGADAKAFMVLAVLFPTPPFIPVPGFDVTLPLTLWPIPVFPFIIIANGVVLAALIPLALAIRNALHGQFSRTMFVGRPVAATRVPSLHGRLLHAPNSYETGLDFEVLRRYLAWRGTTLDELRDDPSAAKHPTPDDIPVDDLPPSLMDDPWAAEAFIETTPYPTYGNGAADIRRGLGLLTTRDTVWISDGIPFIVPLTLGLILALTYGSLLLTIITTLG